MIAFKTLKKSDVQVSKYPTNKSWNATPFTYNSLGIKFFVGQNLSSSGIFGSGSDAVTTDSASGETQYRRLIYETVKQLYYSNHLSASYISVSSSFENFEQTTIYNVPSASYQQYYNGPLKYFPTASNSIIRVMSIPQKIYGSKIIPGTFQLSSSGYNIIDDKEGNLFDAGNLVGNIVYPHGLILITNASYSLVFPTASSDSFSFPAGSKSGSFNLAFRGEQIIFENEIRCQVSEGEFVYTLNPSISTDGSGSLVGFATSSVFNPYVTTVGLYNETGDLLAVGKLSKPVPIPKNNDINFIVRWDS